LVYNPSHKSYLSFRFASINRNLVSMKFFSRSLFLNKVSVLSFILITKTYALTFKPLYGDLAAEVKNRCLTRLVSILRSCPCYEFIVRKSIYLGIFSHLSKFKDRFVSVRRPVYSSAACEVYSKEDPCVSELTYCQCDHYWVTIIVSRKSL
jgi:hypothetical protein